MATTTPTAHPTFTVQGHCGHNHPPRLTPPSQFKDTVATTTPRLNPPSQFKDTVVTTTPTAHPTFTVQGHCGHNHPHSSPHLHSSMTLWSQPPPRLTPPSQFKGTVATTTPTAHPTFTVQGHCGHNHPHSSPHLHSSRTLWPQPPPRLTPPSQFKDTVVTTTPTAHPTFTVQGHCGHNHPHGSPHLQQFKDTVATTTPTAHPTFTVQGHCGHNHPTAHPTFTVQGHCGHNHPHGSHHLHSSRTLWPQPPPQLTPPSQFNDTVATTTPQLTPPSQFKGTVATTTPTAHPTFTVQGQIAQLLKANFMCHRCQHK